MMKYFIILALIFITTSAIHIPKNYAHYKPGYMRIPEWEKITSGQRKLKQKEPTLTFKPKDGGLTRVECGIPGSKLDDRRAKIDDGQEARPHQFPWQVGIYMDGYFCTGTIISKYEL